MIKWCKYWRKRPVRDEISVENKISPTSARRPVMDGISVENCVPNGTPKLSYASVFYRHRIPNGMTKLMRHFLDNMTLVAIREICGKISLCSLKFFLTNFLILIL